MNQILNIYIGTDAYICINAILRKEGLEKVKDYYKNSNQEKILEDLEQIFNKEDFEEFKKLLTQKATIDFLRSDEKFESTNKLNDFLLENCLIDLNTVLNDYIKLDYSELLKVYR